MRLRLGPFAGSERKDPATVNTDQPREELYRRPSVTITNALSPVNAFEPRGGSEAPSLSRKDSCGEDNRLAQSH